MFNDFCRTSSQNGTRSRLWYPNVIKLLRMNCASNKIMRLLDVNLPTNPTKLDPGSNVKWTPWQLLEWACRYIILLKITALPHFLLLTQMPIYPMDNLEGLTFAQLSSVDNLEFSYLSCSILFVVVFCTFHS